MLTEKRLNFHLVYEDVRILEQISPFLGQLLMDIVRKVEFKKVDFLNSSFLKFKKIESMIFEFHFFHRYKKVENRTF